MKPFACLTDTFRLQVSHFVICFDSFFDLSLSGFQMIGWKDRLKAITYRKWGDYLRNDQFEETFFDVYSLLNCPLPMTNLEM